MPDGQKTVAERALAEVLAQLAAHPAFIEELCAQADLQRWDGAKEGFSRQLARSVISRFKNETPDWRAVEEYLATLQLEDLALACGCAGGEEAAWDFFVREYRGYLRKCAGAMLRRGAESPEARELADSLFAELYGLADGRRGAGSLFRYFHGRSTLKTWLRAVLAQRHVDGIRAARRFDALDETDGEARLSVRDGSSSLEPSRNNSSRGASRPDSGPRALPPDPHREKYIALFCAALHEALARLTPEDHRRICLYYAEGKTLAEIGRVCGEHESSASRNLERIRRELRAQVEGYLRAGRPGAAETGTDVAKVNGLSEAQIALCLQYATEDSPIDFTLMFPKGAGTEEQEAATGDVAHRSVARSEARDEARNDTRHDARGQKP
jgi:RNA polymerase sigma factor (sigma-70 family)